MKTWALLDYGVGNLHSLQRALTRAGADAIITADQDAFLDADVSVLPGVGAFGHVMASLAPIADSIGQRHEDGRPILGVCIGQQVLHTASEETPGVAGLGVLPGTVKRLPSDAGKVPHMGWNTIAAKPDNPLLGPANGQHVYYVHSYAAMPAESTLATTTYGATFAAAERLGNTVAFQFHPEKSGTVGAGILARTVQTLEAEL